MKRTQIYLDENIFDLLRQRSKVERKSISEIIRQAMEVHLQTNIIRIRNQVDRVTGIRSGRRGDVDEQIRKLRRDRQP